MIKLDAKTRQEILSQLLAREQETKPSPASQKPDQKTAQPSSNQSLINSRLVKKELLKIALVTFICLAIIFAAWYLDLTTDILSRQAQKITQILHL